MGAGTSDTGGPRMHARLARSLAAAVLLLAACDQGARPTSDPYDASKMDLKPTPAKLSSERHQGAFAEGSALSLGAELKPLDPAPVKTVRLDTVHKIVEIAPGVKFSAWTFGNQVPGPTVRARVGDKIRFIMTNRSDEAAPGVRLTAAPMMTRWTSTRRWCRRRTSTARSRRDRRWSSSSR